MGDFKILAVDDSPTMRRIIINTLKRAGYQDVVEAQDGKDALAKLKVDKFNFVITDWNMPEMDGLTFVTTLRSMDEFKNLPVLMVTTRSVKEDIMEAMKAGVNNYIVKPFTPETLKAKIEQIMAS
ncbi:MAG: response regulator [candidate division Zixibacteria bacterium]|nr:response regulator [candidate division Zixibacteria bacterium]MDD5426133.1 response regulator [candidate division Zixibacteria bacterium]